MVRWLRILRLQSTIIETHFASGLCRHTLYLNSNCKAALQMVSNIRVSFSKWSMYFSQVYFCCTALTFHCSLVVMHITSNDVMWLWRNAEHEHHISVWFQAAAAICQFMLLFFLLFSFPFSTATFKKAISKWPYARVLSTMKFWNALCAVAAGHGRGAGVSCKMNVCERAKTSNGWLFRR